MATVYLNNTLNNQGITLTIGRNNVFACLTPKMAGAIVEDFLTDEKKFWRKWNPSLVADKQQTAIVQKDENLPDGTKSQG